MAADPRKLRPSELCRLLNSTPLGEVLNERQLHRHRTRAGMRIGDGRFVDLLRYVAWLVEVRHAPKPERDGDPYENLTQGNKATQVDRAEFRKTYGNLEHGVLKLDLVTFEITGNTSLLTQYVLVRLFALGDLNQNGTVSEADFALFGDLWGLTYLDEGYNPSADFDENGVIDAIDYGLFADYLMQQVPAASSALALLAGMIFFSRRRRAAA